MVVVGERTLVSGVSDENGPVERGRFLWSRVALVGVIALVVRLVVQWEAREVPTARHLIGDAAGYFEWAQRIAAGEWIGQESFYQAPLYPYLLAVGMRFLGLGADGIRAMQAVWGAAACGCLCIAASWLFNRRAGLIAGLMLALYGPAIYYDGLIQKASLTGLLTCGVILVAARIAVQPRGGLLLALGVVVALLCLTRENALVWVVLLGLWLVATSSVHSTFENRPSTIRRLRRVAPYILGVALVLFPVALRNKVVGGEWSLSTFQAGPNFYIGNHRGADGRYQPLVRGHETPQFEREDAKNVAQMGSGRGLSPREVSSYWLRRALVDIADDPIAWLKLWGYKVLLALNRYEIADAESLYVYQESSAVLGILGRLWRFGTLAPLAVVGIMVTFRQRRGVGLHLWMLGTMLAAVTAFYVLGRYRYPLVPLLILLAAVGLHSTWDAFRSWNVAMLLRALVVGAIAGIVVNIPIQDERRLDSLARMNAGVALAQAGEVDAAIPWFERAVADHPTSPEGHNNLAQAFALRGRFAEAVKHYETALKLAPDLPGVHYNLGVALEGAGRSADALRYYRAGVEKDPSDQEAAAACLRLGGG